MDHFIGQVQVQFLLIRKEVLKGQLEFTVLTIYSLDGQRNKINITYLDNTF